MGGPDPRLRGFPQWIAVIGALVFVGSLLYFCWAYAAGFDRAPLMLSPALAVLWDVGLFSVFALHHSVFARLGLKQWIRRLATPALERSIYVWISSVLFIAVCAWWRGVPRDVWNLSGAAGWLMRAGQFAGAILAVMSARQLGVLELAGVRQTFVVDERPAAGMVTIDRGPYRLVRHPIYLGWFAMVWLAPYMNGARIVFAAISCLYLVLALPFEERDLRRVFGSSYDDYMRRVRWKILPGLF